MVVHPMSGGGKPHLGPRSEDDGSQRGQRQEHQRECNDRDDVHATVALGGGIGAGAERGSSPQPCLRRPHASHPTHNRGPERSGQRNIFGEVPELDRPTAQSRHERFGRTQSVGPEDRPGPRCRPRWNRLMPPSKQEGSRSDCSCCNSSPIYQRCISPARTGACRTVRPVPGSADIAPARSLRSSTNRYEPARPDTPAFRLWEQEAGSSNLPTPTTSTVSAALRCITDVPVLLRERVASRMGANLPRWGNELGFR
jgi:hypothetical protein